MYSIIDFGLMDFIRDVYGKPWVFETYRDAEDWLLENGELYGWTNQGTLYFNWLEEGK